MDFTAGKVAECLIGLKNEAQDNITVAYVHGVIAHPKDYKFVIQNVSWAI